MKTIQKGFVTPLLLAIIGILLIGGGAYVYMQQKSANQPEVANQTADWKTYTNTKDGYQLKYPADWQTEEKPSVSIRIFNPSVQGKPDTDQPSDVFILTFEQTQCKASDWQVGFGFADYKTACVGNNPDIKIIMSALSEQSKNIEDQILSSLKFAK